jgi:hypothetical protein
LPWALLLNRFAVREIEPAPLAIVSIGNFKTSIKCILTFVLLFVKSIGLRFNETRGAICLETVTAVNSAQKTWLDYLSDEDLTFVKRFLLTSGSLKELAQAYGISYPTVRLRLDRLIAKIQVVEDQQVTSPFEKVLRVQVAEGKIDLGTFKRLLAAHREEMENSHET